MRTYIFLSLVFLLWGCQQQKAVESRQKRVSSTHFCISSNLSAKIPAFLAKHREFFPDAGAHLYILYFVSYQKNQTTLNLFSDKQSLYSVYFTNPDTFFVFGKDIVLISTGMRNFQSYDSLHCSSIIEAIQDTIPGFWAPNMGGDFLGMKITADSGKVTFMKMFREPSPQRSKEMIRFFPPARFRSS